MTLTTPSFTSQLRGCQSPCVGTRQDHSWGLVRTTVLELVHRGARYVAKSGDTKDHQLARQVTRHEQLGIVVRVHELRCPPA